MDAPMTDDASAPESPPAQPRPTALPLPDRAELQPLLQRYNEHPETRAGILATIVGRFRRDVPVLLVRTDDAWGDEMKVASKLGEDSAECDEILLGEAAGKALREDHGIELAAREYAIAGIALPAFRVGA